MTIVIVLLCENQNGDVSDAGITYCSCFSRNNSLQTIWEL